MVEIRIVKTKKDKRNFVNFENKLYSECEYFIPTIYKEAICLFSNKKNPNLMSNEISGYLAYQEGKLVGRVLCLFNRIEKEEKNIIRFSHLDFINDTEVSFALFDTIEKWAKFLKADRIIGDISFNDLNNIGLLDSGFDKISTFQQRYNYPYYSEHLKAYGFSSCKKMHEYQLKLKEEISEDNIDSILDKHNYHLITGTKEFKIKNYGRKVFDLLYENSISGFPIVVDEKVYENFFKHLNKLFLDDDFIIVTNNNDEVVGAMLLTNNTSVALQVTNGKVLTSKNMYTVDNENNKTLDFSIFITKNTDKETLNKILILVLIDIMKKKNIEYINTNLWIDNKDSFILEYFDIVWQRNRVVFSKKLNNPIVKRTQSDIIVPSFRGNNSVLK